MERDNYDAETSEFVAGNRRGSFVEFYMYRILILTAILLATGILITIIIVTKKGGDYSSIGKVPIPHLKFSNNPTPPTLLAK